MASDDPRDAALRAIASIVGLSDPFNAEPRDVFLRVRRLAHEHELMRVHLHVLVGEVQEAEAALRAVDGGGDHE